MPDRDAVTGALPPGTQRPGQQVENQRRGAVPELKEMPEDFVRLVRRADGLNDGAPAKYGDRADECKEAENTGAGAVDERYRLHVVLYWRWRNHVPACAEVRASSSNASTRVGSRQLDLVSRKPARVVDSNTGAARSSGVQGASGCDSAGKRRTG